MKKMDEIMELLTDEIEGFKRSIGKLEELSKKWDNLKIKADSSHIEFYIKDFLRQQERAVETYRKGVIETHRTIKSATLIPKWVMTLFLIMLALTVFTLAYFGYHFIKFEENRKISFEKGRVEAISELKDYFDDHPIIYEDFQRWAKKKDSLSNHK